MARYVVSDLHGQYGLFLKGLEKTGFSDSDELYVLGDAIDRGPDGIRILLDVRSHENMDLLIGNHEFMMLNAVEPGGARICNGRDAELWLYYNGGDKTFEQYVMLSQETRQSLLDWLRERYVIRTIEVGGRKFCLTHSYYREDLENKKYAELGYQDVWKMVWTSVYRDEWETHGADIYGDYDYTFITGHVPVLAVMRQFSAFSDYNELQIFEKGNFIDIDGGCSIGYHEGIRNGALFLRLDDMEVFPIPMEEP